MRALVLLALLAAPTALSLTADAPDANTSWANPTATTIQPGVQVFTSGSQCTTNFVFTSPDNSSVYIGLAAHCVDGLPIGTPATFNVPGTGKLAYSSWRTMDDVGETNGRALAYNDFALIRIDDEWRHRVSPAMRHFGGPVAMADTTVDVKQGDKVLTYGNSGLRMGVEQSNWHEGYVLNEFRDWHRDVWTATPGVFGDSGSGMMTSDGKAMGIVVTISYLGATNGITMVDDAVDYARTKGDLDVRLATWRLVNPGVAPAPLG